MTKLRPKNNSQGTAIVLRLGMHKGRYYRQFWRNLQQTRLDNQFNV